MKKLTYDKLLEHLKNSKQITFGRFGDGEWNAIFNKTGSNCDGHEYFSDMGKALSTSLSRKPEYHLGMQSLAMRVRGEEINAYLKGNGINNLNWCDADILHKASINGELKKFFDVVDKVENVVIVAPKYINEIQRFFSFDYQVVVPDKNCWLEKDRIMLDTTGCIDKLKSTGHVLVLFVASMMSNVLIDRLHQLYGNQVSLIDAGSIFDPFVNRHTRSYHKNMDIKKLNINKKN